jgi:hypothetical protein
MAGGDIIPTPPVMDTVEVDYGQIFGQSRTFYVNRAYTDSLTNKRSSLATGGYIGYKSPTLSGLSLGVALYGTYGFDMHDQTAKVAGKTLYDPSLYGDNFENYGFVGQAYLNYAYGKTNLKVGRQQLDTPMAGSDDARMLPNLFEAVVLSNTDIEDTTLILAHVTKETVGTFGNVYGTAGALSLQSGYGLGYKLGTDGNFATMGEIALGAGTDTAGVTAGAIVYQGIEGLTLTAWDYYAHDILNAVYLQADYGWNCLLSDKVKMNASAQYINESDIGDSLAGTVDSNYWAVKLGSTYENLNVYGAYSQTGDSTGSMNGGILTPWGGMPAFTQGMVTRHQFFANTQSWKVGGTYNFAEYGVKAGAYYTSFDIGAENTYANGTAWTASEAGFDISYDVASVKGLNLRVRGNFPRDFGYSLGQPFGWDEYRVIANYSF